MNWCACGHRWCEARRACKGVAENLVWNPWSSTHTKAAEQPRTPGGDFYAEGRFEDILSDGEALRGLVREFVREQQTRYEYETSRGFTWR